MKIKLILLCLLCVLSRPCSAQTNSIVFPELLSPTNSVLMTNAEFRTFSGKKIFFKNDAGYKSFTAADLNTNVLAALGTSAAKLDAQQAALDAANKKYRDSVAAYQAEQIRQKNLAILQQAQIDAAYQQQLKKQQESHGQNFYYTTPRESDGIGAP